MPKFRNIPSSSSKKNLHAPLFDPQTLLPTDQIIDLARYAGVDFGPGDPAERIRYFIKLGILPHAVRKIPDKTSNFKLQTSNLPATPVGHLSYSSVKKLIDVDRLYKKGLSYPRIAEKLTSEEEIKTEQEEARLLPPKTKPIEDAKPRIIYVQKIGNKDIKDTLKQHELKLEKLVRDEFAHSLSLGKTESDVQETSTLKDQLIPTQEIIAKAKTAGVSFGNGNPYERIRHLIKLGILPHMVRKIPDEPSALSVQRSAVIGHLPEWSVKRLVYIDKLHQNGLTFEQIAQRIQKLEQARFVRAKAKQATSTPSLISELPEGDKPSINFFPKIGVSEKYIDKKLEEYEANFHKILDYKLAQAPLSLGSTPIDFEPKSKISVYFKGLAITTSLTILVSIGIISGRNYLSPDQNKQIQENQNISSNLVGEVLAATSDTHRLYIDADTQVSGTTLFAQNITAPNVLYGAVAGAGITVSTGQTPTIGLDSSATVTSVNDLAGDLTISGSGGTTITASGSTIKISSTSSALTSESDTLSSVTDRGASTSTALTFSGSLTLSAFSSSGGVLYTNGSGTVAQVTAGTSSQCLLGGTAPTFGSCGSGGMTSFTLSGDSGTDQTISDTNTLEVAGGTNGIDTVAGATDTVTLNFDSTEVGTTTWGSGSSIAWTFNAGATDPVLTFDSNALTIGSAATITATAVTAFNCTDCLDFDDLEDTLDIDATTTINTTATTTTPLSYLADSLTTGIGLLISADALTTGTALDVSSTSTAGGASGTSYVLNLARSGANSNTAHTAYGLASSVTNTNATSGSNIAGYFTATGATTANYALYIPNQTDATGPNYGLYVAGADDYSIYSAAGDIYFGMGTSTTDQLRLVSTTSTATTVGVFDLDITSNTNNNRGIDLAYTFGGGLNSRGYGMYNTYTTSGTSLNYNYGIYQLLTDGSSSLGKYNYGLYSDLALSTTDATNSYAGYFNVNSNAAAASDTFSLYGANVHSGAISSGTKNVYGIYANGDADSTASGGTSNAYGGYFVGDGDTDGTGTAYGIYATASGGDTNYAGIFVGDVDISGHSALGNNASINSSYVLNIDETFTGSGAFDGVLLIPRYTGTNTSVVLTSAEIGGSWQGDTGSTATRVTALRLAPIQNSSTAITNLYGLNTFLSNDSSAGSGTITNAYGAYFSAGFGGVVSLTNSYGVRINDFGVSGATATYGIYIDPQSGSSSNYGLCFDCDGTWTSSTVASGIQFGTDASQVSLYRGANNALRLDDQFQLSNSSTTCTAYATGGNEACIWFGSDTNLYRSAASALTTDDSLKVSNYMAIGTNSSILSYVGIFLDSSLTASSGDTWGQFNRVNPTSATTNLFSVAVANPIAAGGSATNNYGIYVYDQTLGSTSDYGIYIEGADTAMLFFGEAPASASTAGLCWDNSGASAVTDCSSAPTDLAEYFATEDGQIEAGDIVAPSGEAYEAPGPRDGSFATKASVAKSTSNYQPDILGVVSTNPNIVFGDDELFSEEENPKPISLVGRVPVKVSSENDPIKVGDYITSSSIAGVGMRATKAGRVVGIALSSFNCSTEIIEDSICQGQIIVFVNPTFYLGTNLASNESLGSSTNDEGLTTNEALLTDNQINPDGTVNCQLSVVSCQLEGQILTAPQVLSFVEGQIQRLVTAEVSRQLASSPIPDRYSSFVNEASDSAKPSEATDSAGLAQQTQQTLDELDELLSTTHISLDTLAVTGNTNLAQTQVAGTFSQDGTLIIDYGKQINVLGSTLYLQNDPLAGCSAFSDPVSENPDETGSSCASGVLVNIGAGKLTIDNQGNLVASGKLTADSIQTKKLIVYTDEGNAKTVGTSSIPPGSSAQTIFTTALEPKAKILITPRTPTGGKTIYISESVDFEGFTVSLENGPATGEIRFDWLIVNTSQVSAELSSEL